MKEHLHPSLVRLYGGASDDDAFFTSMSRTRCLTNTRAGPFISWQQ